MNRRGFLAAFAAAPVAALPWPKPEPTALSERERAVLDALAVLARVHNPGRDGMLHACYGDQAKTMLAKVHDALDAYGTPPSGSWDPDKEKA